MDPNGLARLWGNHKVNTHSAEGSRSQNMMQWLKSAAHSDQFYREILTFSFSLFWFYGSQTHQTVDRYC